MAPSLHEWEEKMPLVWCQWMEKLSVGGKIGTPWCQWQYKMPLEYSCVGINGRQIWRYVCMSGKKNFLGGVMSPRRIALASMSV